MRSLSQLIQTINQSTYKLDLTGAVGLFGGSNAVDALETIHLYAGRRWSGWYIYPGAATVARRFGQMAEGQLWDGLFPGPNESPEITFNLAGKSGPHYSGAFSGTKLQTRYLGHLIAEVCKDYTSKPLRLIREDGTEARETGSSTAVTVVTLLPQQHENISWSLTTNRISITNQKYEVTLINAKRDPLLLLWAIVPSLVSILAFVFCLLGRDYLCASLVLLGIISSGFSSLALGTATLKIRVPVPSVVSPPGDGLMLPADGSIIVLKGQEADVNVITKGEFELDYSNGVLPHEKHHTIGATSVLLMAQFLAQLLLVPLCTFFGQITFLISLVVSGGYHLYVASHEREKVHRELLLQRLSMQMDKRKLGSRVQVAVFACLVLGDSDRRGQPMPNPYAVLSHILPNDTPVWRYWKKKVLKELQRFWDWDSESSLPYTPSIQASPEDQAGTGERPDFTKDDTQLLNVLIDDAWCVFNGYPKWRNGESEAGREQGDHAEGLGQANLLPRGSLV